MKRVSPVTISKIDAKMRRRALAKKKNNWCTHCGQNLHMQTYTLNAAMVRFLTALARREVKYGGGWHKTVDFVPKGGHPDQKRSSDGPYLRYWGMILVADGSVNAAGAPVGSYQITPLGTEFLKDLTLVSARANVINGHLWTMSGPQVTVHTAAKKHFDYNLDVLST